MRTFSIIICLAVLSSCTAQKLPEIISNKQVTAAHYLPDFSYAGYKNGTTSIPDILGTVVNATDYGVIANDGLDDSKALIKAIAAASAMNGAVTLQLPAGRLILSDIIFIERSDFILRGAGSGVDGTQLYFPRPLMYVPNPDGLKELREYLTTFDKVQREKENNVNLPFSQYAWSGGYIWTQVPGERVKSYLEHYEVPNKVLAMAQSGNRGDKTVVVKDAGLLKVGDVVELQLFNKDGKTGSIINELYNGANVKVGSHHWEFPELPIVRQQVEIVAIKGNKVTLNTPLTIAVKPSYEARFIEWKHLKNVGISHLSIEFPITPRVAHHVEQGFNGINLTRLYDSWVHDIVINNADSGILTEEIANVTIKDITTTGDHYAHYTVAMAGVHNVLADRIVVKNKAEHPLSFNTFSTKNVYRNCEVFVDPVLDQHSGANHQNLFDSIKVHIDNTGITEYPLFAGGGADYWKPSHGAYSTLWNIQAVFKNTSTSSKPFVLNGMLDGPDALVIGVHGNLEIKVNYEPNSYIESTNVDLKNIPSLYDYQMKQRLSKK